MTEEKQSSDSLSAVRDIRSMMERSSRFISLSGMSGVCAGICALIGAAIARYVIFTDYYHGYELRGYFDDAAFADLRMKLVLLAIAVFIAAFVSAFYFTWRKSNKLGVQIWTPTSRRLFWNMAIPLVAGGCFILGMLYYNDWNYVSPACLLFYGLALVNASKYTLTDIRYLGCCQIIAGLVNMFWIGYGLYFWAFGFGILHIIYGLVMYYKYERTAN